MSFSSLSSCFNMSLELRRRAELSSKQIAELDGAMAAFYRNPPANYYQMADQAAQHYNAKEQPFHCDLAACVSPGGFFLEIGCGTAHLCPHVEERGGIYTGIDYSEQLITENQRRFPRARFLRIGTPLTESFDIVASLYTIEHVVDPPAYLELMWRHCRPGGLLAVICPEFVECPSLPPSLFYGRTPRRLRQKLRKLALADAFGHLVDLQVRGPLWQKRAQQGPPGAFWMNLRPRVLHGAEYDIDADAVHLARLRDLVFFFEQKGARIVRTSQTMPDVSPEVLRYNCYVLARNP